MGNPLVNNHRLNNPRRSLRAFSRYAITLLVLVAVATTATTALACPTCTDGLAGNDPGSQAIARGYFYSILFMMAMPFVIIGTFGGAAYLSIRRAREQQEAEQPNDSNLNPTSYQKASSPLRS